MIMLRLAPRIAMRNNSPCGNQTVWVLHTCRVLPGCMMTHSKISINIHVTIWRPGGGGGAGKKAGWGGWGRALGNEGLGDSDICH